MDISKAFDKVPRLLLLKKLIKVGIGKYMLHALKQLYKLTNCVIKFQGVSLKQLYKLTNCVIKFQGVSLKQLYKLTNCVINQLYKLTNCVIKQLYKLTNCVIKQLYKLTNCVIKFQGVSSKIFAMCSGIRQGAASSVLLFNAFMDGLFEYLRCNCTVEDLLQDIPSLMYTDNNII